MPKNRKVEIILRNGKPWIKVTPLDPQPEPRNLASLKAEVGNRWSQVYLLDILKEADLRIGFTNLFKSPTSHEILPRDTLQIRLLLCLYGLGTNAGIKRVASGAQINYRDLLYILCRFINKVVALGLWYIGMSRKKHYVFIRRSNGAPHRKWLP